MVKIIARGSVFLNTEDVQKKPKHFLLNYYFLTNYFSINQTLLKSSSLVSLCGCIFEEIMSSAFSCGSKTESESQGQIPPRQCDVRCDHKVFLKPETILVVSSFQLYQQS